MRVAVVVALVAGCFADHTHSAVEIQTLDCDTCHHNKFLEARQMLTDHPDATTCGNCHRTNDTGKGLADWKPALIDRGPHPDDKFVISRGPHQPILCADCHDPQINPDSKVKTDSTADHPDNVICTNCHTGDHAVARMASTHHVGEPDMVVGYDPTRCRTCHQFGFK
jgi:hypothetical protein